MRIVFTVLGNSRRSNYLDGNTMRYGRGGGSGTDGSTIIVAEQLAARGHDVVIVSEKLETRLEEEYAAKGIFFNPGKKVRGVTYTNFEFEGVTDRTFDILVNSLWFSKYDELPIKVTKAMIYWCHMQWIYGISEMVDYCEKNNLALGYVNISRWEREMNKGPVSYALHKYNRVKTGIIPNPVMDDIINEVLSTNPVRKPHKFVFHALWSRGGDVAVNAVNELGYTDSEFHAFDYLMCIHGHTHPWFHLHGGADKKTLFTHIAESDYFIYPLYTPYKNVHKDTFSCAVAEAIALGAVVVTYPLGALPENFDGYCEWLDWPPGAKPDVMQTEQLSQDSDGVFNYTKNIVEKIRYLEANPHIKEKYRREGRRYILDNLSAEKTGDRWETYINELLSL